MSLQRLTGLQRNHWNENVALAVPSHPDTLAASCDPTTGSPVREDVYLGNLANCGVAELHDVRWKLPVKDACGLSACTFVPSEFIRSSSSPDSANTICVPSGDHDGANAD